MTLKGFTLRSMVDIRWNFILSDNTLERFAAGLFIEIIRKYDKIWFVCVCRLLAACLKTRK